MAKTTKKIRTTPAKKAIAKVVPLKGTKAFKTYNEAIEYLFKKTDYEQQKRVRYNVTTFNLSRMENLLSLVGNPHKKIVTAHIAGTKGKGSTATMLARMLEYNNYKVGLYTSPHLLHLHERIMINSQMISEDEMLGLLNRLHGPVEKLSQKDQPTFFEIMTAMAFMYFADAKVDIAVIETGLGGRLDSTNVITPRIVGITSLSIDHQLQLGNTITSIAKEKAGIFKAGVPAISVKQAPEAMQVLRSEAAARKTPLMVAGTDIDFSYRFEMSREYGPHTRVCLTTPVSRFEHVRVPLHGRHQAINCGLALAMLDKLKESGYNIDIEKATAGLGSVQLPGRMEIIWDDPRIMIDAAHNAASIKALVEATGQNIPYDSMVVIFGCGADKDIRGMLTELQFGADKVIFTRSSNPRAASPQELADIYLEITGKVCQTASSLGEALQLAQNVVSGEDLICVTGSFYLIGQAKARFLSKNRPGAALKPVTQERAAPGV